MASLEDYFKNLGTKKMNLQFSTSKPSPSLGLLVEKIQEFIPSRMESERHYSTLSSGTKHLKTDQIQIPKMPFELIVLVIYSILLFIFLINFLS
jgi:hypothetical protein